MSDLFRKKKCPKCGALDSIIFTRERFIRQATLDGGRMRLEERIPPTCSKCRTAFPRGTMFEEVLY